MNKDESHKDRIMDALLREDARGANDEEFLSALEKKIEAAGEGGEVEKRERSAVPGWLWGTAAAAAACVGAVVGYEVFFGDGGQMGVKSNARYDLAMREGEAPNADPRTDLRESSVEAKPQAPNARGVQAPGSITIRREPPGPAVVSGLDSSLAGGTDYSRGGERARLKKLWIDFDQRDAIAPEQGARRILAGKELADAKRELSEIELHFSKYDGRAPVLSEKERAMHRKMNILRTRIAATEQRRNAPPVDRERYGQLVDQPWHAPWQTPLSTFSVDVDTASYTNVRRLLRSGASIPKDAVRIEEFVNYFDYSYPKPQADGPFAVHVDMASCPWKAEHHLVKIGLKGKEVDGNTRPPSNLVFLIDVSGSMKSANKLPLLVESMKILVEELDERDSVGIVVYAGSAGTILEPTKVVGNGRTEILSALDHLRAGGSTAGAAGIRGAYDLAAKHFRKDGVNRVILATDGDFNVGTSSTGELVDLVKERAKSGVFLSVLGFGTGNINDAMMEAITNDGNGNYFYIDSQREGRKVFLQNLSGTLVTIAKDVKIQVEFNPGKVAAYRLIGYANRILPPEAFNDDKIDAGDIGAGHTVTALYEIVPVGVEPPAIGGVDKLKYQKPANRAPVDSPEWMTVKLRYKAPDGDKSSLLELPVKNDVVDWTTADCDFQMAAGVALFGEKLRQSDKIDDAAWELVEDLAQRGAKEDRHGHRKEFLELVRMAGRLPQPQPNHPVTPRDPVPAIEAPKAE